MTLLAFEGFEMGDGPVTQAWIGSSFWGVTASGTRFGYGQAGTSSANSVIGPKCAFTASSQVFVGIAVKVGTSVPGFSFMADSGATEHVRVSCAADGSVAVTRAGTALAGGTLPAGTLVTGWNYIEATAVISDTVGLVKIRVNGSATDALSISGLDTRNAGTSTNIDAIAIAGNAVTSTQYDDMYVCNSLGSINNTFLGDVRVYSLAPTGAGNYTQFVPSTGANWAAVDEQPYSATDYVGSPTSGNRDSYVLTDLPATVGTVFGTREELVAAKSDAGAASIKQSLRIASTDYDGSALTLGTTYVGFITVRETNPNTAAAWTPAGVNGAEIGVVVT
jgi:hypothetical protein